MTPRFLSAHRSSAGTVVLAVLLAVLLAFAAGLCRAATPGLDAPPEPGPVQKAAVPAFDEQRLPNGLRVVVARRAELPLVTAVLQWQVGANADPVGHAGLASLTATLLTKGATLGGRTLDATQIARQAEALGSPIEATGGWLTTSVGMTVTTPQLDSAVALIAAVVRRPTLADAELRRARAQAIDSLKVELAEPATLSSRVARRVFWGAGAYGAVTTPASLTRITRSDVVSFQRQGLRPDQATLILAGDITPAQAAALARRHFGDWQATRLTAGAPTAPDATAAAPLDASLVLIDLPGAGQSGVVVAAPFVDGRAADRRIGQVASAVLGGGYSARLNQEVRIKRGLSYGASASTETFPVGGMMTARAQTQNATAAQVVELVRGEVQRLGETPAPAAELLARQATLVGGFGRSLETTHGLAGVIGSQIANGRPLDDIARLPDEVMAVTAEQVRSFAASRWAASAVRTVVVGDLKASGDALRKLDPKALVIDAKLLDLDRPDLTK